MKKFFKRIDWKKFLRYELYSFALIVILYFNSLYQKWNIFPENIWIIPFIVIIWGFMLLLASIGPYLIELEKQRKDKKDNFHPIFNSPEKTNNL